MTATELAAVIVTISSVAAAVVLVFGLIAVNRTLKQLRDAVDELRTETASVVAEIRDTVYAANYELNRVDELLGTAESIGGKVDSATRVAHVAFSTPVIKSLALASGTGKAAKSFRRRRGT
jgi:uncharacterized protein YoxC